MLAVLSVGKPFFRLLGLSGGNHIPTGLIEDNCVNIDVFFYPIPTEEYLPNQSVLLGLSYANLEAPGNGLKALFAVDATLLSLLENGRLDQPATLAEGTGVIERLDQLFVAQVCHRLKEQGKGIFSFVEILEYRRGIQIWVIQAGASPVHLCVCPVP